MEKEKDLRRLVIKAFHITDVEEGEENKVTASGKMTIEKRILDDILPKYPQLSKLDVQIIKPGEHDRYTNTMMDIIPISTKVLGKIGDGITHTLTGVYVILTGVDENGYNTDHGIIAGTIRMSNVKESIVNEYKKKFVGINFVVDNYAQEDAIRTNTGVTITTDDGKVLLMNMNT